MNPRHRTLGTYAWTAALALRAWCSDVRAGEAPAPAAPPSAPAPVAKEQAAAAERAEKERQLGEAQRNLEAAARQVAELSRQLGAEAGNRFTMRYGGPPPRAMLGVQLSNSEGQGGAKVIDVSPGGPAAEAGIKAGDVIISIGGADLTKDSNPGQALTERMSQADPNLKVQVGVLRDGKKQTIDVTPRPAPDVMWGSARVRGGPPGAQTFAFTQGGPGGLPLPGMPGMAGITGAPGMAGPGVRQFVLERDDGGMGQRFRGMEFATLSEQLGTYFGVKSGVLVVRAGNDPAFKLKDGDVILAIDGRAPTSAQHAGRILRSYQAGEKLSIRVQRDRKPQNVEVTVPSGRDD